MATSARPRPRTPRAPKRLPLLDKRKAILTHTHEVYDANVDEWLRNERRLYGGIAVLKELAAWDYEDANDSTGQYAQRAAQAVYVNFPALYAMTIAGHLAAEFPMPAPAGALSFGALGDVPRERNRAAPSRSELVYYNVDGVGVDGSEWPNFWRDALTRAIGTGHRWMYVDTPGAPAGPDGEPRPAMQNAEIRGFRPFLREYSPIIVPDWHDENGQFRYAIIKVNARRPRLDGETGTVVGAGVDDGYLFLSARDFDGYDLGGEEDFSVGGWWLYDAEFDLLERGPFDSTGGALPFFPFFWQRSSGVPGELPAISKSGIFEQGQAAVAHMNVSSAATFDAIDAAKSLTILLNTDREGYELFNELIQAGSQVTVAKPAAGSQHPVSVQDGSSGAVTAQVFDLLLTRLENIAKFVSALNATSVPDSSGLSKAAGFAEGMGPRLAGAASETEQAMNSAIWFFEQRWGFPRPSGSTTLKRKYDLVALRNKLASFYATMRLIGLTSKTLDVTAAINLAREEGVIGDDEQAATVRAELEQSATDRSARSAQMASLLGGLDSTGDAGVGDGA